MGLKEFVSSLPADKQYAIAIRLAKLALPIWKQYADANELTYRDSVVGLTHRVDRKLIERCINSLEDYTSSNAVNKKGNDLDALYHQLLDPIASIQDCDWDLPYEVATLFYSIYNLIRSAIGQNQTIFDESSIYVSINQAADALVTAKKFSFEDIEKILEEISTAN